MLRSMLAPAETTTLSAMTVWGLILAPGSILAFSPITTGPSSSSSFTCVRRPTKMFSLRRVPGGLTSFPRPARPPPPSPARPPARLLVPLRPPADEDVLPEARTRRSHVLYPPVEHVPLRHGEL